LGFVVNKLALGQVFTDYFGFPCQSDALTARDIRPSLFSRRKKIFEESSGKLPDAAIFV
jgi:hypothetical protein